MIYNKPFQKRLERNIIVGVINRRNGFDFQLFFRIFAIITRPTRLTSPITKYPSKCFKFELEVSELPLTKPAVEVEFFSEADVNSIFSLLFCPYSVNSITESVSRVSFFSCSSRLVPESSVDLTV
jgi:hypothetical protein